MKDFFDYNLMFDDESELRAQRRVRKCKEKEFLGFDFKVKRSAREAEARRQKKRVWEFQE